MRTIFLLALAWLLPFLLAGQEPSGNLHMAALQGDAGAAESLIRAGADLNAKDAYGSTPLNVAVTFDKPEVARLLLEAGADPGITNNEGSTPLHVAALFGYQELARILLENGADPNALTQNGGRPYDIAAGPLARDKPILDQLAAGLAPLGFQLDYPTLIEGRKAIATMLRAASVDLAPVDYAPLDRPDWPVSTPKAEGLDPVLVAELYRDAARSKNLYSLLIVKNGKLVAEGYFNNGGVDHYNRLASVTKSVTSALTGLALQRGELKSTDQRLLDFFPEMKGEVADPRKADITIRQLLQMRGGYPWEETDTALWAGLLSGYYVPIIETFPLVADPGAAFNYSNLSSNWLGMIIDRASGMRLRDYAIDHLFEPMDIQPGEWGTDAEGHNNGCANLHLRSRDMAKFGLLYLNEGSWDGDQLLPADWVAASLAQYSPDAWVALPPQQFVGRHFNDLNYGYQWWTATTGGRTYPFAWGHGGQLIVLLEDQDMVIVATSDPYFLQHDAESWQMEQLTFNIVGKFLQLLP